MDWLTKAANALLAAEVLEGAGRNMAESMVFHAQQTAENALIGFLVAQGKQAAKSKSLPVLLDQCAALDPSFGRVDLTGMDSPAAALARAKYLLELVRVHLPAEIREAL